MPNKLEEMFATDITEYILKIGNKMTESMNRYE